jgi:tetratricopeptide (TPR) repeat protein
MDRQGDFLLDRIDRYLMGQLTEAEKRQFETEFASDEALRDSVRYRQDLMAALKTEGRDALRKELKTLEQASRRPSTFGLRLHPLRIWYFSAAAAAVAVLIALALFNSGRQQSKDLFATHFQPYPNVLVPMERDENTPGDLPARAFGYYEQGAYDRAIPILQQLAEGDPQSDYGYYLAMCYLELGEADRAISLLEPLSRSTRTRFARHAQWYLALAFLKSGKQQEAIGLLREITANPGHPFLQQAEELLREIPRRDSR